MIDLLEEQLKAVKENRPFAMVTLVKTAGATPRHVGSKMLVFADGTFMGTIGGGVLEKKVLDDAVQIAGTNGKELREYENRSEETDSPCGGIITVYMEAGSTAPQLIVCGASHVGGAIIHMAGVLGYHVTAIDTRNTEMTHENVRGADRFILAESFSEGIKALDVCADAFYMVSTFGHGEDCEALEAVFSRESAYVGMMGSQGKINAIFNRLREKGIGEEELSRVHAPVGLDIGGETPPEIALSVLAEMQLVRYSGSGRSLRTPVKRGDGR